MWEKCSCYCKDNHKNMGKYCIAFGLGVSCACWCPTAMLMFFTALIITAMGIIVIKV